MAGAAFAGILLLASPLSAGKFNRVLDVGDDAPSWKALPGTDGKAHSLADLQEKKTVVLVFMRNHCPVSQRTEAELNGIVDQYAERGAAVVAVNVAKKDGEGLAEMTARVRDQKLAYPYLKDISQNLGRAYGATATPQVFVLGPADKDGRRKIVYMGAADDRRGGPRAERRYLLEALDALLAGKEIDTAETLPYGCEIDYEKSTPQP